MIKFKVIEEYPNSPYPVGEVIEFKKKWLGTHEMETLKMMRQYPTIFEEVLEGGGYYVLQDSQGYATEISNSFPNTPHVFFDTEEGALMYYAKNKQLFSYEDVSKLPLEANQLEFFMQTIKKLVNEDKSTD